ncbi:hypothetical protein [Embleya sp. NPDC020886]|uniref:hypothetical protein n=1 Tax=Embleya sp. NPDC020886 TaxID=3363980 RepID=UPI0037B04BB2
MPDPLPPPTVDHAVADVLDARHVPLEATVRVAPYPDMAVGDLLTLSWHGPDTAAFTVSVPITGHALGRPVVFKVPAAEILPHAGGDVTLSYRLERPGAELAGDSAERVLRIELAEAATATEVR